MPPPNLPPPRKRQTSSDDVQDWRLDAVEEEVKGLRSEMKTLGGEMKALGAVITAESAKTRAAGASENVKLICSTLTAVVLAIAGAYGVQKFQAPPNIPSTPITVKSPFEKALDLCRDINDLPARSACAARIYSENITQRP